MNRLSDILLKKHNKIRILSQFEKDLVYLNLLFEKIFQFDDFKKMNNYRNISVKYNKSYKRTKNFSVFYIISISFLKANTMIHVSDIKGNVKFFFNAGNVNLVGKQKKRRVIAILRLIKLIYRKASFLFGKPIALHLNNVNRNKKLILNKLKQKFFIKIIREFNKTAYNGCRLPKIRRKKYKKKII